MRHYHKNPRQITKKQLDELAHDLKALGDLSGITHDLDTDEILTGNQRCEALPGVMSGLVQPEITQRFEPPLEDGTALLGYYIIDDKMYSYRAIKGWNDKKREWANVAANKRGGTWDFDILANSFELPDLLDYGFSELELAGYFDGGESVDAEPQTDRAEELREKWGVESGQLWQIGEHLLYCGDFREFGKTGEGLIFDPPWDTEIDYDFSIYDNILAFSDGQRIGDVVSRFGVPVWLFVWNTGANWYTPNRPLKGHKSCLWYGDVDNYLWDGSFWGEPDKSHVVSNTRGKYLYQPDPRGKHLADLFFSPITSEHDEGSSHSKPLDWVRMLIANCTSGDVYDPFCGTGTSIIAAQQLGRRCYASEINPLQVALTLERAHLFGIKDIRRDG